MFGIVLLAAALGGAPDFASPFDVPYHAVPLLSSAERSVLLAKLTPPTRTICEGGVCKVISLAPASADYSESHEKTTVEKRTVHRSSRGMARGRFGRGGFLSRLREKLSSRKSSRVGCGFLGCRK